MVRTGKPSGGCDVCRKRRIKCDETRPVCLYCRRRQLPCKLPESQFDLAWRDQNEVASKGVLRRLKARDKANRDDDDQGQALAKRSVWEVPRFLAEDYIEYGNAFFFSEYIFLSLDANFQQGFLDILLPVLKESGPESPLRPAVNAVALCLLEAWSSLNPDSPQSLARSHYVQGVSAIRRRMENGDEVDDDVLMATLMLHMYDGITSFCGGRPYKGPHLAGSAALIERRLARPINGHLSERLILGVRSQIVGRALTDRKPISRDFTNWTKSFRNIPRTLVFVLEEIDCEIANLQVEALALKDQINNQSSMTLEVLAQASAIDQQLITWTKTVPEDWTLGCIWEPEDISQSIRDAGFYQVPCTVYQSIFAANILNGHCCSRINVLLVILGCLEHLDEPYFQSWRANAYESVQDLADSICSSVPFFLGDRIGARRIDDKTVQYPELASTGTPAKHYSMAAAYAGVFLSKQLAGLLRPDLPLRNGQKAWIGGQLHRIRRIYASQAT